MGLQTLTSEKSVFQCLYSQCDTVHFGSALHFAISQCVDTGSPLVFGVPPIPNHNSLRKRKEAEYLAEKKQKRFESGVSGVALATESAVFPVESVGFPVESAGFPMQSANFPTRSVVFPVQSAMNSWGASASPSPTPNVLLPRGIDGVFVTVSTTVTTRISPVTKVVKPFPTYVKRKVHSGIAKRIGPCLALHVLSTGLAIYLSL